MSGGRGVFLLGRPERVSPADAAMVNGTAIHGYEIDDVHVSSSLHPASVTVPAAFAAIESRGGTGRDLLVALAAGYECGIRTGICAGITHSTSGFHVTGTAGPIGAAAAVAKVLRLDRRARPCTPSPSAPPRPAGSMPPAWAPWPSASMPAARRRAASPRRFLAGKGLHRQPRSPSRRRSAAS